MTEYKQTRLGDLPIFRRSRALLLESKRIVDALKTQAEQTRDALVAERDRLKASVSELEGRSARKGPSARPRLRLDAASPAKGR